jgi:hypothetical protein
MFKFHVVEVVFNVVLVCLIMGKYTLVWKLNNLIDTERTATNMYEHIRIFLNALDEKAFRCFVAFVMVVAGLYPW